MADELVSTLQQGLGINSQSVASAGGWIFWIVILVVVVIIFGILIFILSSLAQFKHTFQVKDKTSGVNIVIQDKARIFYDKNGNELKWKLLRLNAEIPIPPKWAREQTEKGKFFVRAIRTSETGFLCIDPENKESARLKGKTGSKIQTKTSSNKKSNYIALQYVNPDEENNEVSTESLTTNTKVFLLDQFRIAELEKPQKTWQQVISEIAVPMAFILFVLLILIFGKNLVTPVMQANEQHGKLLDRYISILDREDKILAKYETLETGIKTFSAQTQNINLTRPD